MKYISYVGGTKDHNIGVVKLYMKKLLHISVSSNVVQNFTRIKSLITILTIQFSVDALNEGLQLKYYAVEAYYYGLRENFTWL